MGPWLVRFVDGGFLFGCWGVDFGGDVLISSRCPREDGIQEVDTVIPFGQTSFALVVLNSDGEQLSQEIRGMCMRIGFEKA